jgi:hypothetical protein
VIESIDQRHNNADRYYRTNEISGYVQDKWQIAAEPEPHAGVRYDYHGGMTEKYGNMFNFDPASTTSPEHRRPDSPSTTPASSSPATTSTTPPPASATQPSQAAMGHLAPPRLCLVARAEPRQGCLLSGGAGIYYDRGELFSYLSSPRAARSAVPSA